jgi:hypothetical protein
MKAMNAHEKKIEAIFVHMKTKTWSQRVIFAVKFHCKTGKERLNRTLGTVKKLQRNI